MKKLKFLFVITFILISHQKNFPFIKITNKTNQPCAVTILRENEEIDEFRLNNSETAENFITISNHCESGMLDVDQYVIKPYRNNEHQKILVMNVLYYNPDPNNRMILIILKKGEEIQDGVEYEIWLRDRKLVCTERIM